jgi:hypothetical protein
VPGRAGTGHVSEVGPDSRAFCSVNSVNFFNNYPISYCASNDLQENGLVPQFYCVVVLKKDFEKTGSGRYLLGVYEIPPPYDLESIFWW